MRRAFTIVEVLVAAGLATVVLGTGVLMFLNGSKGFTKATQHSSVREQALMILERVGRDLEGLIVSQEINTRTGRFFMVQPFELMPEGKGIRFHVYHRTEMVRIKDPYGADRKEEVEKETDERLEPEDGSLRLPRVVGRYVEYRSLPSSDGKGVDLLRNGVKINLIPLTEVSFKRGDPVHAVKTMGASPNAVLNVKVVPRAGMEGELAEDIVRRQDEGGVALSRVFHLVGYESQYTALLGVALERYHAKSPLDPVEISILRDAKVWGVLEKADENLNKAPLRYRLPDTLIHIEVDKPYDSAQRPDPEFSRADTRQGGTMASALKRGGAGSGSSHASAGSGSALQGAP